MGRKAICGQCPAAHIPSTQFPREFITACKEEIVSACQQTLSPHSTRGTCSFLCRKMVYQLWLESPCDITTVWILSWSL